MIGKHSPWGIIDQADKVVDGIWFVTTSSHGGIKLDRCRNSMIPSYLRQAGGWYEEDCLCSIPICFFCQHFSLSQIDWAYKVFGNWYPEEFSKFFGYLPEQSYMFEKMQFFQQNKDKWIVTSIFTHFGGRVPKHFVGGIAYLGGQRSSNVKRVLISEERYRTKHRFGFVLDGTEQEIPNHGLSDLQIF